jgi:hypothetical protein
MKKGKALVTTGTESRTFRNIAIAAAAGKIKVASIWGTKLKWKQGWVSGIDLATRAGE